MTTVNVQAAEFAARYVDPEGVPISANQALLGSGSPSAPKIGTLIPNRIFVGGIPSNTTEQELKAYFSSFGQVKDVKIINDRLGVAKGSYGFVTFECQEVAEKIIKNESETLIFKDRKLNIGHAIRKQQLFPRPADVAPTLFFPGGAAIPCGFQSGLPVFPLTGQDYSVLAQQGSAYQQMLLQQANGAAMYLSPQSANQQAAAAAAAAVQYSALQSQLAAAQQNAAAYATLQQQQQQHQQYPQAASLTGQITTTGSQSQAAMLAAAMAAASQWPNAASTPVNGHNTSGSVPPSLTPAPVGQHTAPTAVDASQSPNVAALAAAAAAAAWRWFSPAAVTQHNGNGTLLASSPTAACGQSASQQQIHSGEHQQQLVFLPNTTTTSDYSTDHSAHSSGLLESVEPGMFHCEGLSMSPPQHPLQPTLLPFFAPAVFDSGIAATSSPVIARQIVSPSNTNGHIITNGTNGTSQTPQSQNLYATPAPQPIIYSGAGVNGNGLVVVDHTGKQNGGGRGSSPKKLTTTNGAAASTRTAI